MQRLTVAGRLIITLAVLAAFYFGFRYFMGSRPGAGADVVQTTSGIDPLPGNAPVSEGAPADINADEYGPAGADPSQLKS